MPATAPSAQDLSRIAGLEPDLHPWVLRTYHRIQSELCAGADFVGLLGECRRSASRQLRLYRQTRQLVDGSWVPIPGVKHVTNARPWEGPHVVGRAWHLVLYRAPGGPWLPDGHPAWGDLGRIAENEGWHWGGRWESQDKSHLEQPDWKELSAHAMSALRRVWKEEV